MTVSTPKQRAEKAIQTIKANAKPSILKEGSEFATADSLTSVFVTGNFSQNERVSILAQKIEEFLILKLTKILESNENSQSRGLELLKQFPCSMIGDKRYFKIHEDLIEEMASQKELHLTKLEDALDGSKLAKEISEGYADITTEILITRVKKYLTEAIKIHLEDNGIEPSPSVIENMASKYCFRKNAASAYHISAKLITGDEIVAPLEQVLKGKSPEADNLRNQGWLSLNRLSQEVGIDANTAGNKYRELIIQAEELGIDLSEHSRKVVLLPVKNKTTMISPFIAKDFEVDGKKFDGIITRLDRVREIRNASEVTASNAEKGSEPSPKITP